MGGGEEMNGGNKGMGGGAISAGGLSERLVVRPEGETVNGSSSAGRGAVVRLSMQGYTHTHTHVNMGQLFHMAFEAKHVHPH